MIHLKKCAILCCAVLLLLSAAGCKSGGKSVSALASSSAASAASSSTSSEAASSSESAQATSAAEVPFLPATVDWETTVYEDTYLKYEIPANWVENPEYSNTEMRLTFFNSSNPATNMPSNVNVQVTNIEPPSSNIRSIDYSDPATQRDFHRFLLTQAGLPAEAKNGTYTVDQTPDCYVYSIRFTRSLGEGVTVEQTAFFPMGLDYAVAIWATDWHDDVAPSAVDTAMHICSTLELKKPAQ